MHIITTDIALASWLTKRFYHAAFQQTNNQQWALKAWPTDRPQLSNDYIKVGKMHARTYLLKCPLLRSWSPPDLTHSSQLWEVKCHAVQFCQVNPPLTIRTIWYKSCFSSLNEQLLQIMNTRTLQKPSLEQDICVQVISISCLKPKN